MVFQDYALFPHLTVAANVAFGLRKSRPTRCRTNGRRAARSPRPHALREQLPAHALRRRTAARRPRARPGTRTTRAADGRALLEPRRPACGIASVRRRSRVLRETRTTTIVVTHDPGEAMRIADRIALLRAGRLLQVGSAEDLYSRPATAFAARFLSDVNELAGTCRNGRVDTALGTLSCAGHAATRRTVRVCIRPQHVRLAAGPDGIRARVVARRVPRRDRTPHARRAGCGRTRLAARVRPRTAVSR